MISQRKRGGSFTRATQVLRGINTLREFEIDESVNTICIDKFHSYLHPDRQRLVSSDDATLSRAVDQPDISTTLGHARDLGVEHLSDAWSKSIGLRFLAATAFELSRCAFGL